MNIRPSEARKSPIRSGARNFLITIWLVVFCYLGTFYIVLSTLSAYQVLQRAKDISGDENTNVTALIEQSSQIAYLEERRDQAQRQLERLNNQINEQQDKFAGALLSDAEQVSDTFYMNLDPFAENAGLDSSDWFYPEDYRAQYDQITAGLSEEEKDFFDATLTAFEAESGDVMTATDSEAQDLLTSLSGLYNFQYEELKAVNKSLNSYTADQKKLAAAIVVEVRSLRPYFHVFVTQAESVLVFLLAIAMGALGSTIHITQSFLAGETHRPLTWYLIRPLLGTVTAVAIYILAKAGQLVIDPSTSTETMSPWFISFLAVISGLLSENAIQRISNAGKTFFETEDSQASHRWAVQLTDKLADHGIEPEHLAAALRVSVSKLTSWANEIEAVPPHEQDIIAAWLRLPLREVFSDIEPATTQ